MGPRKSNLQSFLSPYYKIKIAALTTKLDRECSQRTFEELLSPTYHFSIGQINGLREDFCCSTSGFLGFGKIPVNGQHSSNRLPPFRSLNAKSNFEFQ